MEDMGFHLAAYNSNNSLAFAGSDNSAQLMDIGIGWANCSFDEFQVCVGNN